MTITDPAQRPLADRALGELAYMLAKVGRISELDTGEIMTDPLCGGTTLADRGRAGAPSCSPLNRSVRAGRSGERVRSSSSPADTADPQSAGGGAATDQSSRGDRSGSSTLLVTPSRFI
jgi:hypothetical protein